MGRVVAICVSERKGTRKSPAPRARLVEDQGVEGDAHAGPGRRQISLLMAADIEEMRARGLPGLQHGDFGENLVIGGLDLAALGLGSRLRIGDEAEVAISQRGKTCHVRCAIYSQAGDCIMPRKGLFARVLKGGEISPGGAVAVVETVPLDRVQVAVLTISDKGSRGDRVDTAGPAVSGLLEEHLGARIDAREVLPDERGTIEARLRYHSDGYGVDLIVAIGGTGFAPRDVTPEAVRAVVERLTPGLDEAMRAKSLLMTPHAMLSRGASGILGRTLILSLPGSERAATENLEAILPALPHGLAKLRGDDADCGIG